MVETLTALVALVSWRVVVCLVLALALALVLGLAVPSIAGPLVLTALVLGTGLGLRWQADSERTASDRNPDPPAKLHPVVSFLGLAFIGFAWAGLLSVPLGSLAWATAAVGFSPYLVHPIIARATNTRLTLRQLTFGSLAVTTGPLLVVLFAAVASKNAA